uniref:Putative secreted protein n=1 Tax=Ixodes ricinus TaxID=34613 RepID=A0A6B0U4W7_IXORI
MLTFLASTSAVSLALSLLRRAISSRDCLRWHCSSSKATCRLQPSSTANCISIGVIISALGTGLASRVAATPVAGSLRCVILGSLPLGSVAAQ